MSSAPSPRRGLGRGLEVLIGGQPTTELAHLPIGLVHANPRQPRRRFDHEATAGLAESIRAWPDQPGLATRIEAAGWSGCRWRNLSGGIVALHHATA